MARSPRSRYRALGPEDGAPIDRAVLWLLPSRYEPTEEPVAHHHREKEAHRLCTDPFPPVK